MALPPSWSERFPQRAAAAFLAEHRGSAAALIEAFPRSARAALLGGWDSRIGITTSANGSPVAVANGWVRELAPKLKAARVGLAFDDDAIRDHAENYARLCSDCSSMEKREAIAARAGVVLAEVFGPRLSVASRTARLDDVKWWRRQLRKAWTRAAEDGQRECGMVRKGQQPYASDAAVEIRGARQRRGLEWLETRVMVNGEGEQLELLDIARRSLANPAIRRTEFMVRLRGLDELSQAHGHECDFWTLTTPSAFHAQRIGGGINPRWEAAGRPTVREGQHWLRRMWSKVRAQLARRNVRIYGARTAEPNHDGTPHWHLSVFGAAPDLSAFDVIVRALWLSEFADEPGAHEVRVSCQRIDRAKGSAVGYMAKYIAKNLDGHGAIGEDVDHETGEAVKDGVQRVAAWASAHGIRQFQMFGTAPVGVWREVRRLRDEVPADRIEAARAAADRCSWADFVQALGGPERAARRVVSVRTKFSRELRAPRVLSEVRGPRGGRRYRPARPEEMPAVWLDRAEPRRDDPRGREVLAVNFYGEQPAPRAAGVCAFGLLGRFQSADTRPHRWRIERKGQGAELPGSEGRCRGPAARQATARASSDRSSPRSGVLSDLGPVAIIVRGADQGAGQPAGDPGAWTARETSTAGPHAH